MGGSVTTFEQRCVTEHSGSLLLHFFTSIMLIRYSKSCSKIKTRKETKFDASNKRYIWPVVLVRTKRGGT